MKTDWLLQMHFIFVWNATRFVMDLPTVFHKDGVIDLKGMDELVLPARYFGNIQVADYNCN